MSKHANGRKTLTGAEKRKPDWYIDQIVDRMCRGNWIRGATRRQLAAEWGIPESTVANYSTTASKIVKAGTDDEVREEIKATSIEKLGIIAAKAEKKERFAEATKSLRVMNELTGSIQSGGPMVVVNVEVAGQKLRAQPQDVALYASAVTRVLLDTGTQEQIRAVRDLLMQFGMAGASEPAALTSGESQ